MEFVEDDIRMLYNQIIQAYNNHPKKLMGDIIDEFLSGYCEEASKYLSEKIIGMMNSSISGGIDPDFKLSEFEKDTNNLYEEFISSDNIETLFISIKKLKAQIDHFKQHRIKENLVMPIRDFESLYTELNALEYGLSHWVEIKEYIATKNNKQMDIQKGLGLDKQSLSTFFYMMDRLGFVKKETLKNRVYIKII